MSAFRTAALLAAALASFATPAKAQSTPAAPAASAPAPDHAEVDTTQIIGNRELPKVLYIVPWKRPLAPTLSGKPPASVLDEALAPLDREVFRRQVNYAAPPPADAAAADAAPKR